MTCSIVLGAAYIPAQRIRAEGNVIHPPSLGYAVLQLAAKPVTRQAVVHPLLRLLRRAVQQQQPVLPAGAQLNFDATSRRRCLGSARQGL